MSVRVRHASEPPTPDEVQAEREYDEMLRELGRVTLEAGELENWLALLVLALEGKDPWAWSSPVHSKVSRASAERLRDRLCKAAPNWPTYGAELLAWERDVRNVLIRRHDLVHSYAIMRRKGSGLEMVFRNPRSGAIGPRDAKTLTALAEDLRAVRARGSTLLVRVWPTGP